LAALLVAPFCAGVVALGIWRAAFLSLARPGTKPGVWRVGLALGAGFLAGAALSLQTIATHDRAFAQAPGSPILRVVVSSPMFGAGIGWALLALSSLVLFVLWLDAAAGLWLARGGERAPRLASAAAILAGGSLLTVWTGLFFYLHDLGVP